MAVRPMMSFLISRWKPRFRITVARLGMQRFCKPAARRVIGQALCLVIACPALPHRKVSMRESLFLHSPRDFS